MSQRNSVDSWWYPLNQLMEYNYQFYVRILIYPFCRTLEHSLNLLQHLNSTNAFIKKNKFF